jgi:hypothetical protein
MGGSRSKAWGAGAVWTGSEGATAAQASGGVPREEVWKEQEKGAAWEEGSLLPRRAGGTAAAEAERGRVKGQGRWRRPEVRETSAWEEASLLPLRAGRTAAQRQTWRDKQR